MLPCSQNEHVNLVTQVQHHARHRPGPHGHREAKAVVSETPIPPVVEAELRRAHPSNPLLHPHRGKSPDLDPGRGREQFIQGRQAEFQGRERDVASMLDLSDRQVRDLILGWVVDGWLVMAAARLRLEGCPGQANPLPRRPERIQGLGERSHRLPALEGKVVPDLTISELPESLTHVRQSSSTVPVSRCFAIPRSQSHAPRCPKWTWVRGLVQ